MSDSLFHDSYASCRTAFLDQAAVSNATVRTFVHPHAVGADGEDLAIDVAYMGRADARRLLVFTSGIHGCEGYAGSALQLLAMRELSSSDPDVAWLFIHGLNPYGWSHSSRTNEHHVDLNRNFVEFPRRDAPSALAADIQRVSAFATTQGPDFARIASESEKLIGEYGIVAVGEALQQGQYWKPDGVGFGGDRPEWSRGILERIWADYFPSRTVVGVVDWHTGIGAYGEPVILCFDEPRGEAHEYAAAWWGADRLASSGEGYEGGQRPEYSGLHVVAAQEAARRFGAVAVGAVVEWGTFEPMEAAACLWIDRWLRNPPADAEPERIIALRQRARRFFSPDDAEWKQSVRLRGGELITQCLTGIRAVA